MATLLCAVTALSVTGWSPSVTEASTFHSSEGLETAAAAEGANPIPYSVIPLGSVFGIKLFTDGVIVASLSDIYTKDGMRCPAEEAGVRPGDYVLEADGVPVENNAAMARLIGSSQGQPMTLTVKRGQQLLDVTVTPVYSDGAFKTGMWIRDSAAGIGTLTFWDPVSGKFAGLGHGICDMDTGNVMSLESGQPAPITLCGIIRGEPSEPGQLRGYFSSADPLGVLEQNNDDGVYGVLNEAPEGECVEVMPKSQVHRGSVQIMATIDENGPQLYEGEIQRISAENQRTRNLVVKITDPRLLEATGGIVQGMSGCPIFQDGKLAGAVTHVFTDDPSMGYGIFAQTMCEEIARTASP